MSSINSIIGQISQITHTFALFDSWEIENPMTPVVVPQFFHQEDVATQPLNSGPS